MNKPVRVILLGEADSEYKRLNELVGQQLMEGIGKALKKSNCCVPSSRRWTL
ncbi:hypothetical protein HYU18_04130 [Candidatus Woesearchaeota archaeon]|nr:hypothetical protein [Candidatus Woesearchaeota archaeon]